MAVANCPRCGKFISQKTMICKNCNYHASNDDFQNDNRNNNNSKVGSVTGLKDEEYIHLLYNELDNITNFLDSKTQMNFIQSGYRVKLTNLINQYYKLLLTTNLKPIAPMSASNAGIIGSAVGGPAIGVAAAIDAEAKRIKYEQDKERYKQKQIEKSELPLVKKRLEKCYDEIISIIKKNAEASKYWENKKNEYLMEKEEKKRLEEEENKKALAQKAKDDQNNAIMLFVTILVLFVLMSSCGLLS